MKILFVENHSTFPETVTGLFLTNHEVTTVGSVMEALTLWRQGAFDVVLVDYDLDDFKGDVFVRRLRAGGSNIPIIAISGKDEGTTSLLEAGANAVCPKGSFRGIGAVLERVQLLRAEESCPPSLSALVHAAIVERGARAIYVARRNVTTFFVGGPDFTDDDPLAFHPMSLADAISLDRSLSELAHLAVGDCAFRSDPSEPWSYGLIPLGVTFLITYDARPAESNPEHDQVAGAFVNCWVVADSMDSALRITAAHLVENGWVIVERVEGQTAPLEDFEGDPYFRQAQIDGLVAVFHKYPRNEPDLN